MIHKSRAAILFCTALFSGCGGSSNSTPLGPPVTVSVSGLSAPMNTGASHKFTASVNNSSNQGVTWSILESGGGAITKSGVYTAPPTPGTYTVKAVAQADSGASATAPVPVVIPEGHIAGYDVGVDYLATGADFLHTAFITTYDQSAVRQSVLSQLQGIADRGATVILHPNLARDRARNFQLW